MSSNSKFGIVFCLASVFLWAVVPNSRADGTHFDQIHVTSDAWLATDSGKVGVGTSNPNEFLSIRGLDSDSSENLLSIRKDDSGGAARQFFIAVDPLSSDILLTTDGTLNHPSLSFGAGSQASHMSISPEGDIFFSENVGVISPHISDNEQVPVDFWYDAAHRRLHTRTVMLSEVGDPGEVALRRAKGIYPNQLSPYGVDANTNIGLIHWTASCGIDCGFQNRIAQIYARNTIVPQKDGSTGGEIILATTTDGTGKPVDRMVIKNDGNVGILTPNSMLHVNGGLTLESYPNGAATDVCRNGGILGTCSSSRRFKQNIQELDLGLDTVLKLKPRQFIWKPGFGEESDLGLVAEEVEEVSSLLVTYRDGDPMGVKYKQLAALLIKAVQELESRVRTQEKEIQSLKTMVANSVNIK